jgi:uncharacterized membrane protein YozB (DUF420 family)
LFCRNVLKCYGKMASKTRTPRGFLLVVALAFLILLANSGFKFESVLAHTGNFESMVNPYAINLIIQIAFLAIIIEGFILVRKGNFRAHDRLMTIIIAANALMIITVMAPALVDLISDFITNADWPPTLFIMTAIPHGILGTIAEALGLTLILKDPLKLRITKTPTLKTLMRLTITVWIGSSIFGVAHYLIHIVG